MKRALATEMQLRQRRGWWASKRAMMRAARAMAMATATKRAMATDGDNTGNGYGEEASGRAMATAMAMGMGTVRRTWLLTLQLERGG
jgi:hypothetical protein